MAAIDIKCKREEVKAMFGMEPFQAKKTTKFVVNAAKLV